ncbi:MAG: flagellar assembly protein FliW [Oscillospiraceae bacterium]|jgi:flagellar assembly factor FliW|nr:flagellar assembly protein FliW [Oscillospiraceae bacterium]
MQIDTIRFGQVEIDDMKIIRFESGIPGLEEYLSYALLQFDESYPIMWLQSVEDKTICLPVLDTFAVIPTYVFDIDDKDVKDLHLNGPEDLYVASVLVIPDDIRMMTVNLAAPIIINTVTGTAKQILLSGSDYNVRAPVFPDICKAFMDEEDGDDAGSVKEAE